MAFFGVLFLILSAGLSPSAYADIVPFNCNGGLQRRDQTLEKHLFSLQDDTLAAYALNKNGAEKPPEQRGTELVPYQEGNNPSENESFAVKVANRLLSLIGVKPIQNTPPELKPLVASTPKTKLKKPRQMTFAKFTFANAIKIYGDVALVAYDGYPDTNEVELRDLKTGALIASHEWDHKEFGMFSIDAFSYDPMTAEAVLYTHSSFGETLETKDKDVFFIWNTLTGEFQEHFDDRTFVQGQGQTAAAHSGLESQVPYFLRGQIPSSNSPSVQLLNYKNDRAISIPDASFSTFRVIGWNRSIFNAAGKYLLYQQKDVKNIALVPFGVVEQALAKSGPGAGRLLAPIIGDTPKSEETGIKIFKHTGSVSQALSSSTGRLLATVTPSEGLTLWNTKTGQVLFQQPAITSSETRLRFSLSDQVVSAYDPHKKTLTFISTSGSFSTQIVENVSWGETSTLAWSSDGRFGVFYHHPLHQWIRVGFSESDPDLLEVALQSDIRFEHFRETHRNNTDQSFLTPDNRYLVTLSRLHLGLETELWLEAYDLHEKRYVRGELISKNVTFPWVEVSGDRERVVYNTGETEAAIIQIKTWIRNGDFPFK